MNELPLPTERWVFDYMSGVGPSYVHVSLGLRFVWAERAFALHVGLIFGELLIQFNRKVRVVE